MKRKVLITGANGQLGSEIKACSPKYLNNAFIYTDVADLDITNPASLENFIKTTGKLDYIVNCAAYTAVDKAEDEPELAELINATACKNLADICKKHAIRLIHISTDYVFDGKNYTPYEETDSTSPNSSYGRTKRNGEIHVAEIAPEFIILRTSWLYSSFGNNFVKTIQKLARNRDDLNVLYDQIGSPTYARDLAISILEIIEGCDNGKKFISGIYHFSNEGVCSWYDFAKEIIELSKISCDIHPIRSAQFPQKANRPAYSVMDKAKIKNTYQIQIPFWKDSLKDCIHLIEQS